MSIYLEKSIVKYNSQGYSGNELLKILFLPSHTSLFIDLFRFDCISVVQMYKCTNVCDKKLSLRIRAFHIQPIL